MSNQPGEALRRTDYLLLASFCLLFFGFSLVGGRPLSMHEGVLPQTAREMLSDHDWVVPKNGGRPWLESPPLPQWITVGIASVIGRCDEVWIVRIGPALMGSPFSSTATKTALNICPYLSPHFGPLNGWLSDTPSSKNVTVCPA